MSKQINQADKILLRLSPALMLAIDQIVTEVLPEMNRSEFVRRACRYTLDNIDDFRSSKSSVVTETENVQSVAKINAVRELYSDLFRYTEQLQKEPNASHQIKQLAHLIRMIGTMIFRMND